jgi:hypothetical protein
LARTLLIGRVSAVVVDLGDRPDPVVRAWGCEPTDWRV